MSEDGIAAPHEYRPVVFSEQCFDVWLSRFRRCGVMLTAYCRAELVEEDEASGSVLLWDRQTDVVFRVCPHGDRRGWWEVTAVYPADAIEPAKSRGRSLNPWHVQYSNRVTKRTS